MRQIKFRIYSTSTKRWYFSDDPDSTMTVKDLSMDHTESWKVMQFTRLKDKYGIEIYEGDIVEINPIDDQWNDFVVYWPERARFELKSFVKNPKPVSNVQLWDMTFGHYNPVVVIGNIYENPELLLK